MSGISPFARRQPPATVPTGDVLVTVPTYGEAQSVVNRLTHAGFSVASVAIVGRDLVTIERVTGRLTYARIALRGALNGGWIGFVAGIFSTGFSGTAVNFSLVSVIAIGAGIGMLIGLAMYSLRRRQHDFSSVQQVLASRYDVIVPTGTGVAARTALDAAPRESD